MYKKDFLTYPSCWCPRAAGPLWVRGVSVQSSQTFMICVTLAFLHGLFQLSFQFLTIHPFLPALSVPVWVMLLQGWFSVLKLPRQHPAVPVWCLPFPPPVHPFKQERKHIGIFFHQIFEVRLNMGPYFKLISGAWVQVIKPITWPAFISCSYAVRLNLHPLRKYFILKSLFTVSLHFHACI